MLKFVSKTSCLMASVLVAALLALPGEAKGPGSAPWITLSGKADPGAVARILGAAEARLGGLSAEMRQRSAGSWQSVLAPDHAGLLRSGVRGVDHEIQTLKGAPLPVHSLELLDAASQHLFDLDLAAGTITYRRASNGLADVAGDILGASQGATETGIRAAEQERAERAPGATMEAGSWAALAVVLLAILSTTGLYGLWTYRRREAPVAHERAARAVPDPRSDLEETLAKIAAHSGSSMPLFRRFQTGRTLAATHRHLR